MKLSLRILVWIFAICDFCSSFTALQQNFRQDRSITFFPITAIATQSSDDGGSLFPSTLFQKAEISATPKKADNEAGAHDSFRYEWGRWVDDAAVEAVMDQINHIQLMHGGKIYDRLIALQRKNMLPHPGSDDHNEKIIEDEEESIENNNNKDMGRRFRISGGDYWDCILHVLPKGMEWQGRWPTGSWSMVKCLTGMGEIAMLRGPDRNGFTKKITTAKLRGGGDGTLGGGRGGGGDDCVKYVGGALRCYSGVGGKTMLIEIVIRPPIGGKGIDGDGNASLDIESFSAEDIIMIDEIMKENSEMKIDDAKIIQVDKLNNTTESQDIEQQIVRQVGEEEEKSNTTSLGARMGLAFEKVGGLDGQLNDIVRRVLASRANRDLSRRLGVNHVRGILLSGPPGCGKTLLARELSEMLGAREPQIVNGPEILDKFIGEAEKNVRQLFEPAELEYEQVGDDSALHVIILDELDAIARRRGSVSGDSTGVRDSVVNQLLSKMDGVKQANNVLVIGLTNRPELLDPALVRPGRLEVQLRVELPDIKGRRDILRIHTRHMKEEGILPAMTESALEDMVNGLPAKTEYFSGAELAGLVRSAASFALARTVEEEYTEDTTVSVTDFERALGEVKPALGKQDEVLESRFPYGISPCSVSMQRLMRDLERFTSTPSYLAEQFVSLEDTTHKNGGPKHPSTLQSLLLVGDGYAGGTGATALACWAASQASNKGHSNYVRLITSLDLLTSTGDSGDESARATAMVERFSEASSMSNALLVFDDVDQICAGAGPGGYSSLMLSTLRALLRSPTVRSSSISADNLDLNNDFAESDSQAKSLSVIASTSRTDAVCTVLHELFDETLVVPELSDVESTNQLFLDAIQQMGALSIDIKDETIYDMAELIVSRLTKVGCKTALRILERAVSMSYRASKENSEKDPSSFLLSSLSGILDDYVRDKEAAERIVCNI